jgi:hypothetical protein
MWVSGYSYSRNKLLNPWKKINCLMVVYVYSVSFARRLSHVYSCMYLKIFNSPEFVIMGIVEVLDGNMVITLA